MMKKISSRFTYWNKRLFPLIWFGLLALFVVFGIATEGGARDPFFLIMPVAMALVSYLMMRKLLWDLADEVYDGGDYLLIRNNGQEERIALSNVMNVGATILQSPSRITLRLVNAGKFGGEISFAPKANFTLNPFAKNAVIEDRIVRVDQARTKRAA
jgi:hypothetical protein